MKLKTTFSIQDKNSIDLDNAKDYSTLKELIQEKKMSTDLANCWDRGCELNHPILVVWSTMISFCFLKSKEI